VTVVPELKLVTTKSSIESAKASRAAARIPGKISGSVTSRKVWNGLAPRSVAASSRLRSNPIRRERTTTTTKLMQNMTCAISSVSKPSDGVPRMRKKERSEAPITTSGVAIGMTIRKFAVRRPKNW
jgi:hypothetical protein